MESESILTRYIVVWTILALISGGLIHRYIKKSDRKIQDGQTVTEARRNLYWKLLGGTLLPAGLLLLIQSVLEYLGVAPKSMLAYVPYLLGFVALFYFAFYFKLLGRIGLNGDHRLYGNLGLILSMLIPPASVVFLYDDFNQTVVLYDPAVKLTAAYIYGPDIRPGNDARLEYTYWRKTEDGDKTIGELNYISLVPVAKGSGETVNDAWVYLSHSRKTAWLKEEQREDSVNAFAKVGRSRYAKVDLSKVKYFTNDYEGRLDKGWKLLEGEGKMNNNAIILNPSWRSLEEDRNSELIMVVVVYLLVFGLTLLMTIPTDPSKKILHSPQADLS